MIKHYGKLIFPSIQLNDEKVARITKGIIKKKDIIIVFNVVMMIVVICQSTILLLDKEIIYCRRCIQLGRIDSITDYRITESTLLKESLNYHLHYQSNNNMHLTLSLKL